MMLSQAAKDPLTVIVGIDPSGLTLAPFEDCGQKLIATGSHNPARYAEILETLIGVMDNRAVELRRAGLDKLEPSLDIPTLLVVLEEYAGTLAACEAHDTLVKPHERIKPRVQNAVGRLLREGAKTQILVWTILQRPDANLVGGADRSQYARRITHRLDNRDGVQMLNEAATENGISKVLTFPPGVGLLNVAGEPYQFFRSAHLPYSEFMQRISANYQPRDLLN